MLMVATVFFEIAWGGGVLPTPLIKDAGTKRLHKGRVKMSMKSGKWAFFNVLKML